MEESIAFSQELPHPYGTRSRGVRLTESTVLVEQSGETDVSEQSLLESSPKKLKPLVYGILFTTSFGTFLWGYNLSVIAGAVLLIDQHFHLNALWHGVVVAAMIAGATIGSVAAGILNDRLGRWKMMVSASILFGIGALLMAFSPTKAVLAVGRLISGMGVGVTTVTSPVYVAELMPNRIRGKLVFLSYVMTGGGVLIAAVVGGIFSIGGPHFTENYGWRCILGIAVVPAVFMFIGLLFTPETPRWLVFHNKVEKARKVLCKIRQRSEVDEELEIITASRDASTQGQSVNFFQFIKGLKDNRAVLYALIVGCSLHVFRSLGGAVIVLNYSATIYKMAGYNQTKSIWLAVVPAGANFAAKFVGSQMLGRMGRRKLYILSSLGAALFLFVLAASFFANNVDSPRAIAASPHGKCDYNRCGKCVSNSHCGIYFHKLNNSIDFPGICCEANSKHKGCAQYPNITQSDVSDVSWFFDHCPDTKFAPLALVATLMYVVFFGIGLAPLPWIINSEIYPTWARGSAVALGSMVTWIGSLLVALTFLLLIDAIGQPYVFCIYGIIVFLGTIFVFFLVPDTKGRDLEETEKLFTRLYFLTWCAKSEKYDAL